jgi:hypothetical protein
MWVPHSSEVPRSSVAFEMEMRSRTFGDDITATSRAASHGAGRVPCATPESRTIFLIPDVFPFRNWLIL